MKRMIFILFIGVYSSALKAQFRTEFTKFYVEDSVGNVDSAEVCWLEDAWRLVLEEGEVNMINEPFDSILAIRFSDGISYGERVSKMNDKYWAPMREIFRPLSSVCMNGFFWA